MMLRRYHVKEVKPDAERETEQGNKKRQTAKKKQTKVKEKE